MPSVYIQGVVRGVSEIREGEKDYFMDLVVYEKSVDRSREFPFVVQVKARERKVLEWFEKEFPGKEVTLRCLLKGYEYTDDQGKKRYGMRLNYHSSEGDRKPEKK